MTVIEDPIVVRHRAAAFDYRRLFDGRAWELGADDFGGRTIGQAYNTIRHAAWRHGLVVNFEFCGDWLRVQAVRNASCLTTN